jgi:hypothetical protein
VHEEVDVILLAVELDQFGFEVGADGLHDFLAAAQDLVGEGPAPVLRSEDQVGVEGVDDRTAPADIGIWCPAW